MPELDNARVQDEDEICSRCRHAEKAAFSQPCVDCGFDHSCFEEEENYDRKRTDHVDPGERSGRTQV